MSFGRMLFALAAIGLATPAIAQTDPATGGDATHGKMLFNQCLICHTVVPGGKKIGPSLYGVIARPGATLPGFEYSTAMQDYAKNVVNADGKGWTDDKLFVYLESPMALVKGTKMTFVGLKKPEDRKDVIAYLNTLHP
jgi:cytochrome c